MLLLCRRCCLALVIRELDGAVDEAQAHRRDPQHLQAAVVVVVLVGGGWGVLEVCRGAASPGRRVGEGRAAAAGAAAAAVGAGGGRTFARDEVPEEGFMAAALLLLIGRWADTRTGR